MSSASAVDPYASLNAGSQSTVQTQNQAGSAERFLKLLVAQMQNQDPMNPMDNAQVTSQMAQINTVSGIETLNDTVKGLNTQFMQMQAVQGALLVGHDVTLAGNKMTMDTTARTGAAGFDLAATADSVKVEILDPSGRVADTMQLGAQKAGRVEFDWKVPAKLDADQNYSYRVTAKSGTLGVSTTTLMRDRVESVSTDGNTLTLELARSGSVPYSAIKAFN